MVSFSLRFSSWSFSLAIKYNTQNHLLVNDAVYYIATYYCKAWRCEQYLNQFCTTNTIFRQLFLQSRMICLSFFYTAKISTTAREVENTWGQACTTLNWAKKCRISWECGQPVSIIRGKKVNPIFFSKTWGIQKKKNGCIENMNFSYRDQASRCC